MIQIQYEDLNTFSPYGGYTAPNEELLIWRELLKNTPIYRAAAICSAGEVGFFALLPLVRKELVLVDHSYTSLQIAMVKYLLLKEKGAAETKRILTGSTAVRTAALNEVKSKLPIKTGNGLDNFTRTKQIPRTWGETPTKLIQKATRKLDRVKFVHGDLTDLIPKGPFGLLYLSNALEHSDRNRQKPPIELIEKIVRPGGYIVLCGKGAPKSWEHIASTKRRRDNDRGFDYQYIDWEQQVYRLPKSSVTA